MLTIRFQKLGKKKQPRLRLVAIDSRAKPQGGKPREILGFWDPLRKVGNFNKEKIARWQSIGATISDTAWNLLVKQKVITEKKRIIKIKKKKSTANPTPAPVTK